MTWEETIESIRSKPEFTTLVHDAYFDSDLVANVERFRAGAEFLETLRLLKLHRPEATSIADIGSGNGISTIGFALEGYTVFSIEPDPSLTIGAGAIRQLSKHFNLDGKVKVAERYGEDTGLQSAQVDVVYIRQAMHHAYRLDGMMNECFRILRPGGLLFTVRDHVIFDDKDKAWFLEAHPLHKFYGGENAYTEHEYKSAMRASGFEVLAMFRYYESIINFFPMTEADVKNLAARKESEILKPLRNKVGAIANISFVREWYKRYRKFNPDTVYDEHRVPGRLYSFIAQKPL